MDSHDDFEVAIERKLHDTLDPKEAEELERHLATCAACRAYEASARQTETGMQNVFAAHSETIDWRKVQAGANRFLRRYRRAIVLAPAGLALVLLVQFLSRRAPNGLQPTWPLVVYAVFVPSYCALMVLALRAVLRRREAAAARLGSLSFYRLEVDRAVRLARWRRWFLPLCGLLSIALAWTDRDPARIWLAAVINPIALLVAAYAHFVQLPRLRREREDLR